MEDRSFLFTDIEGSTDRWEQQDTLMASALLVHDECVHGAIRARGGEIVKHTGDGVLAVFVSAADAVLAAVDA